MNVPMNAYSKKKPALPIPLRVPSPRDAGGGSFPSSPTDHLVSPTSKRLLDQRTLPLHPFIRTANNTSYIPASHGLFTEPVISQFQLANEVQPREVPTSLPIVLGSSSSSRRQIMEMLQWPFEVMVPDIDEKSIRCDDHMKLPLLIAKAKAEAIWERISSSAPPDDQPTEPFILITSDQIVYYNGEVREKPVSEEEASLFLSSYSGRAVSTISAVVVTHWPSGRQSHDVDVATVFWKDISDEVIQRVISRGEIYASAGGFRIEDPDLNPLILDIEGSIDSVMGLPVESLLKTIDMVTEGEDRRESGLSYNDSSASNSSRASGLASGHGFFGSFGDLDIAAEGPTLCTTGYPVVGSSTTLSYKDPNYLPPTRGSIHDRK